MTEEKNQNQEELKNEGPAVEGLDLEELKMKQNFDAMAGVQKLITTIPVRKPDRQWFFRVNPDPNFQLTVGVMEVKEERETYIVHPNLYNELAGEVKSVKLFCCITKQGVFFVWPVPLPDMDGKMNPWHRSAAEAAERAQHAWTRMAANMHVGAYDIFKPLGDLGEPEWPELDMQEIINIAFRDYIIKDVQHPVVKRLRGQI